MPKMCGPSVARMPISDDPEPACDHERDDDAVDRDVELVHELVEPLVHEADLDLAVAHLLEHVVDLVRQVPRDSISSRPSRCACVVSRAGENRSSISSRAYARRPRRR